MSFLYVTHFPVLPISLLQARYSLRRSLIKFNHKRRFAISMFPPRFVVREQGRALIDTRRCVPGIDKPLP